MALTPKITKCKDTVDSQRSTPSCLQYILRPVSFLVAVTLLAPLITGCGDDNDNPLSSGTAYLDVEADPEIIDQGDKTFVRIRVDDIKDEEFFLKVRYPAGMEYLKDSSFVESDGKDISRDPNQEFYNAEEDKNYLIYWLSKEEIDDEDDTTVTLNLVGRSRVSSGKIEVDADLDDPEIANSREVKEEDPQFGAEASVDIQVD